MGARDGLGNLMAVSLYQLEPGLLFAALVTVAAAAAVAALTIEVFERALRHRRAAA
jgi:ABC-type nitrate/sulfonate/bicarbonate transport system permease component